MALYGRLAHHGPESVMPDRFIRMSEYVPRQREWLWRDRIPLRSLTVLDGDPGTNKSTLVCDISARVTRGRAMFGSDEASPPANVLLIQGEDTIDDTMACLRASNADPDRVDVFDRQTGPVALPNDIGFLETAIRATQARLVVLDPVLSFLAVNANSY
jgi:DNA repair protein RadA/Sms